MARYPSLSEPDLNQWLTAKYFRRVGAVVAIAAITATALFVWISRNAALSEVARILAISTIHSISIGAPCAFLLPRIAHRMGKLADRLKTADRLKLPGIMAAIFVLTTVGCFVSNTILQLVHLQQKGQFWTEYGRSWRISIVVALAFGMGSYLYERLRTELELTQLALRTRELDEERTRKLAAEARLSSLEARIHPHFLFNTLNSISSLIPEDPKRAEDMVGKLAALLRFSLDAHQRPLVPLDQEMKIVRDYLEIERARFAGRLRYSIDVAPGAEAAEVPPLSIQTLVENSVKHVVAPRREGGDIAVTVERRNGTLEIAVADSGPGFNLELIAPGHGLDNLQARLNVLFNGSAQLAAGRENGRPAVRITVPAAQI